MTKVQHIAVEKQEAGTRLDRWFKRQFPQVPHGMLEKWLRKGQVKVNSTRIKANYRLEAHDMVRIPPLPEGDSTPKPTYKISAEDKQLLDDILLYEDDDILVINKPAGLAVQGGTKMTRHLDVMLDHWAVDGERPRLVHRLDKDTSGVLVLARTLEAAQRLGDAFKSKIIEKVYWAAVIGNLRKKEGKIDFAISKQGVREKMKVGGPGAQEAVTHYKVMDEAKGITWLELMPVTGRTHQLRVHCAAIDHPILGDGKYGEGASHPFPKRSKLHLHARQLTLTMPNKKKKTFVAPLPEHMHETWDLLFNNE